MNAVVGWFGVKSSLHHALILLVCCTGLFIMNSVVGRFGVKSSSHDATILLVCCTIILLVCCTGLFIMNAVVGRFGVRKTVLVGAVCLSLSAILGSLANDVTSLILSQAVFHGKHDHLM